MKNITDKCYRLLLALNRKGDNLSIEEKRFYSRPYERIMTKYILRRKLPGKPKETLCASYSAVELLKTLVAIWRESGSEQQ